MNNILGIVISFVYIGILMVASKYFEKFDKEASRKFIHILLSNWWLIVMAFFDNIVFAIIPPIAFVIINFLSYKGNLIKVMEREDENKDGLGTVYYAASLIPLVILSYGLTQNPLIGLVGFFIMAYGDGFAAIVGKGIESKKFKIFGSTKSVAGSLVMFVMSFIIALAVFVYSNTTLFFAKAILIAIVATVLEAISAKGTDNITVPVITSLITYFII